MTWKKRTDKISAAEELEVGWLWEMNDTLV